MARVFTWIAAYSLFVIPTWLAEWAIAAFVTWDVHWLSDIAEWHPFNRFTFAFAFGFPAVLWAMAGVIAEMEEP